MVSLKFVPKGPINNIPAFVQIMTWRRPGDKPLCEPMIVYWRKYASLGLNEVSEDLTAALCISTNAALITQEFKYPFMNDKQWKRHTFCTFVCVFLYWLHILFRSCDRIQNKCYNWRKHKQCIQIHALTKYESWPGEVDVKVNRHVCI